MAGRAVHPRPPLITSARFGASLSTDQRARRYVITMLFRVVCFLCAVVAPAPWNVVLFVAAAAAIVLNAMITQPGRAAVGLGVVLAGVPAYLIWRARAARPLVTEPPLATATSDRP